LIRYHAAWILPIAGSPIRDGWVTVDRDRIVALGAQNPTDTVPANDLGNVAILPGLVNAHTHLELSYLRREVPPAADFVTWVRGVVAARRRRPDAKAPEILEGVDRAINESVRSGTALVGDIANTLVTIEPLGRSVLAAVVFYELIRFNPDDADAFVERACRELESFASHERVRTSLAAHAPYSVAPQILRAIRRVSERDPLARCSIHLSESAEEVDFLKTGKGAWRTFLEEVDAWNASWEAPGVSPVQFLDEGGFLDPRLLVVHGVQMSREDLKRLAARGVTLVTCPRSNRHTGAGNPPIEAFYASGVRVAIGTDSLASVADLNVFAELAAARQLAPSVPASALLDSATRQGAHALGFGSEYGSIAPGARARLLAVAVPAGTADVEEYLVSGIQPEQVRWLDS
jgi:cytosine/adenosine deaminase-related metal-dependent hydrolase